MQKITMPFEGKWPITQSFGVKVNYMKCGYHTGIDWGMPKGTPLLACFDGVITKAAKWQLTGYGKEIILQSKEDPNVKAQFAHCSEIFAVEGSEVKAGTILGKSGNTGFVIAIGKTGTGAHLHFGLLVKGIWEDPLKYLEGHTLPIVFETVKIPVTENKEFEAYTVKKGDSLSRIAQKKCGNGSLWTKLYEANKDTVEAPGKIYPGQKIKIPLSLKQNAGNF